MTASDRPEGVRLPSDDMAHEMTERLDASSSTTAISVDETESQSGRTKATPPSPPIDVSSAPSPSSPPPSNSKLAAETPPPRPPFRPLNRAISSSSGRPYSAFSPATKWLIAILSGTAGLLSPMSSNIFVPAIPTLATDFDVTSEKITLGVTIYLIFQAITPSFFGSLSDSYGRRPVYISTLVVYLGSNIGLALMPTSQYWLLLVLRILQATGGSAVISIGSGAVADVAAPRERGKYMGVFQAAASVGPALGPLLGGVFTSTLGWRSIFWFLTIITAIILVPLIFIFPETLRSLVGDGSIPPPMLNASPVTMLRRRRAAKHAETEDNEEIVRPPHIPYKPLSAFMILFTPEILISFVFVSLLYMEFYCILTLYSTTLLDTYHLSELKIGLCYLPGGIGSILSSIINGRQIDYYYQKEEARVGGDYKHNQDEFRIELTRLRCIIPFMFCLLGGAIVLGWCLQAHAPLAVTLVAYFFVGLGTGTINICTVYGQDLKVGQGGAVSASLNLVRCLFGAAGTAVIQIIYNAIGAGWAVVLLTGICLVASPSMIFVVRDASKWRRKRAEKELKKQIERGTDEEQIGATSISSYVYRSHE